MTSTSQLGSHEHHDFPMPLQYQPTPDAMEPTQSAAPRRTTDYGYTFTTPTTFQPTQMQDQGVDWRIQQPQHQTTQLYSGTEAWVQGGWFQFPTATSPTTEPHATPTLLLSLAYLLPSTALTHVCS